MLRATVCSEFFCDPQMWVTLERDLLPGLIRPGRPLNALCVGCGPGLEPFGLATVLADLDPAGGWRIDAFDKDVRAIERARAGGPFAPVDLRFVEPAERSRFFVAYQGQFRVRAFLLDQVRFRVADLREADLGEDRDLILYRNVEPFFSEDENRAQLARLHAALRPGGVVFMSSVDRAPGYAGLGFDMPVRGFLRRTDPALSEVSA